MAAMLLADFIETNRTELLNRCRTKVSEGSGPDPVNRDDNKGVPRFLDELVLVLREGESTTLAIDQSASRHGKELLLEGFTIGQVVHEYGDVCQSVTDLGVEMNAPITVDDFRTLNRCLDDAIAGAVTEYARGETIARDGESQELEIMLNTAIAGFAALRGGNVGFQGPTATLVETSLRQLRARMDHARLTKSSS